VELAIQVVAYKAMALLQAKCAKRCDWVWDCFDRPQLVWKVHGGVGCGSRSNDPLPHPLAWRYSTSLQQLAELPWAIPTDGSGVLGHAIKRSSGSRCDHTWPDPEKQKIAIACSP
jgi:hypothetical protein